MHGAAFASGDAFAGLFGCGRSVCRTVSIKIGMQSSGLATVLARAHLADPLAAIPCAISAVVHSVVGSLLAAVWRLRRGGDAVAGRGKLVSLRRCNALTASLFPQLNHYARVVD